MASEIKCPKCGESKTGKNGKRWSGNHQLQMYLCYNCHKVFSERQLEPDTTPVITPEIKKPEVKKLDLTKVVCPYCGGNEFDNKGYRYSATGKRHDIKCLKCGKRLPPKLVDSL